MAMQSTMDKLFEMRMTTMARAYRDLGDAPGAAEMGFDAFEGRSEVRTWVYRVSLNTCISQDRKKRKQKSIPLSMSMNLFEDQDDDTRQVDMLRRRISRLGAFDRAIILLWLENMSYEEIGQVVGISTKNVSVRLYRIKEQLKNMSNES